MDNSETLLAKETWPKNATSSGLFFIEDLF